MTKEQYEAKVMDMWQRAYCSPLVLKISETCSEFANQAVADFKKAFPPPVESVDQWPSIIPNGVFVMKTESGRYLAQSHKRNDCTAPGETIADAICNLNEMIAKVEEYEKQSTDQPAKPRFPGSKPPNDRREVMVKLNTGEELIGWFMLGAKNWRIYLPGPQRISEELSSPGRAVVEWWEI